MERDDFDRAFGIIREQGRPQLIGLVRLLIRNGYCRSDISAIFAMLGQGLSEDRIGQAADWLLGSSMGRTERERGAFEEFYDLPREESRRVTR